jgi:hypothetical protein
VDYALTHASAFSLSSIVDYCGVSERRGSDGLDEVRRLLAEHVAAGRLRVEYMFVCRRCAGPLEITAQIADAPRVVVCESEFCRLGQRMDPTSARAVFINAS